MQLFPHTCNLRYYTDNCSVTANSCSCTPTSEISIMKFFMSRRLRKLKVTQTQDSYYNKHFPLAQPFWLDTIRCFNAINPSGPQYLADLLKFYAPSHQLRSSADTCTLCIPSVRTKSYGQRAFSHSAPTLWNNLSEAIQNFESALSFKSALKTYLFQLYN